MEQHPATLLEAVTYFSDPDRAHAYAVKMRWPHGIACPRMGCGSASVRAIATRKMWRCKDCKRQFSVRVGTIFEDSPISFSKWLPAFWLLANTKNGTSSCELARALGVTQKTAWFMLHRIREAMKTRAFEQKMSGTVEADETFVGSRHKNQTIRLNRKSAGPHEGKTVVLGMIQRTTKERKSRVRAMVVPNVRTHILVPIICDNVAFGTTLYTDALRSYGPLTQYGFDHTMINHAVKYAEGHVHTNSIENFWSCLKRTLKGTYICARPFHLNAYVAEQVFRFNEREGNDSDRFRLALKAADGRRITYKALTTGHPIWRLKPGRGRNAPSFVGEPQPNTLRGSFL